MAYIPLNLPTLSGTTDFSDAANFLADSAESLVISGNSFLQSLTDLKDANFFSVGDLPSFFSPIFYEGGLGAQAYIRPTRPDMTPPNISALIDRLNSIVLPTPPTDTFDYFDPGYASVMRDPMIAKLLNDLIFGGYGIDDADEARLWQRERDREAALAQANIDELKRQAASTSFPMPQGALYAAIQKARQEYQNKTSSVNRDIGLKRADLYVENRRRVIEQVIAVESQSIALYNAVQGRGLEIAKTQIAMAISLYEAGIKGIELQFSAVLKQIEAQMEFSKTSAMVYNSDIAMYQAYVNALVADSQAFLQTQRNVLEKDRTKLFASVEQVRFRLEQLRLGVENSKDINRYGTEFFRTALGSTMNGINGLAVQTTDVTA